MGFHTYPVDRAAALEDPARYEYVSVNELLALFDPGPGDRVLDVGSGTGFYTDDVAPYAGHVYALDLQVEMHRRYRAKDGPTGDASESTGADGSESSGVPENVTLVTAAADALPFRADTLDAAVTTMTYHEFASERASAELARVLRPGGRVAVADWTRAGEGREGPPLDQRYDAATATEHLERAGFAVERAEDRRETFVLTAVQKSGRSSGGS